METWNTWGTKTTAATTANRSRSKPKATSAVPTSITHEMIAKRAQEIWERKGKPEGLCQQNWLEAEAELKAEAKL